MNDLLLRLRDKGNTVLVVEHEPEGIAIADLPQVIVTPHLGRSRGSFARMAERSAANVHRFLAGEPVRDPVPGLDQAGS